MHETGIYKITNQITQKIYVGQAQDIQRRWQDHRRDAQNYSRSEILKNPLYQDIKKYGLENFTFEIVEECAISELDEKEKYWICYYNSFYTGYNRTEGGQNAPHPVKMTDKLFEQIIYDLKNTLLSTEEIGKKNNISGRMVRDINRGISWKKEYLTYPIRESLIVLNQQKKQEEKVQRQKENPDFIAKQKVQSLEAERLHGLELAKLIVENNFTYVGKYYDISPKTVRRWCKKDNMPTTIEELTNWYYEQIKQPNPKKKEKWAPKKIQQLDPDTKEIIATFPSIHEASAAIGRKNANHIYTGCKDGQKYYGYYWRYLDNGI